MRKSVIAKGIIMSAAAAVVLAGTASAAPAGAEPGGGVPVPFGVLSGDGYRGLKLGMSVAGAQGTGQLGTLSWDTSLCDYYSTASRPEDGRAAIISDRNGLVQVRGAASVRTPEGVRVGSTVAQLKAAYPGAQSYRNGFSAAVPGYSDRFYDFWVDAPTEPYPDDAKVVQVGLNSVHFDC